MKMALLMLSTVLYVGIKFIIDIQDLWPEAFQMVFNTPIISKVVFTPFHWLANAIYRRADEVCAVSNTYTDRALKVNKKCKEGQAVFLGTELDTFDINSTKATEIEKETGITKEDIVIAAEATREGQSIFAYDRSSKPAKAYEMLTKEVMKLGEREKHRDEAAIAR